ncbi:F-box domain, Leucine-rich repeat domain, L domain-like protein [Artemisia annua]|uniref:F-box domain, Leucine-rich repeat domain, L domain-like protein n=1 Tax=Artemisia annua TaxID=35608 RepID=A0A2U1LPE6_ARTAN|nr:F-box domain, Leucine-rich repeat domain, L domain-like protein [Artemisia annua]
MMESTSKSKQIKRDWLELPSDIMANIFSRLCISDILENAQKVCTAWRKISKDPAMWRVINMNDLFDPNESNEDEEEEEDDDEDEYEDDEEEEEVDPKREISREKVCKHLVDRSQGQLVDLTLVSTNNAEILLHVAERSCQLRRLEMVNGYHNWVDALIKFPLLEELNLYSVKITKEEIEVIGRYCPMLKTFKVNSEAYAVPLGDEDDNEPLNAAAFNYYAKLYNEIPIAIGKTLHELRHLELIGSNMTNEALQAILDGCCHLETLDLRCCCPQEVSSSFFYLTQKQRRTNLNLVIHIMLLLSYLSVLKTQVRKIRDINFTRKPNDEPLTFVAWTPPIRSPINTELVWGIITPQRGAPIRYPMGIGAGLGRTFVIGLGIRKAAAPQTRAVAVRGGNSGRVRVGGFGLSVMMASTSKSNRRNRDWLELPSDIMVNILSRLCISDILENAQKVCTAWRRISKEPAMWRVINMNDLFGPNKPDEYEDDDEDEDEYDEEEEEVVSKRKISREKLCKHLVDRSQGQLVDLTLVYTNHAEILLHVAERSCQLRRLEMVNGYGNWVDALIKFPLLEELNLYSVEITKAEIEAVGRYCPMLKILKVNSEEYAVSLEDEDDDDDDPLIAIGFKSSAKVYNELPIAIGKTLHELRHLELIGSNLTNAALQVILDGCRHLESLDLRRCVNIHLKGDLGKRCSEQIKYLKRPNDFPKGIPHIFKPCPYSTEELLELLYYKPGKFDRIMCRYPNYYGDWNDRVDC